MNAMRKAMAVGLVLWAVLPCSCTQFAGHARVPSFGRLDAVDGAGDAVVRPDLRAAPATFPVDRELGLWPVQEPQEERRRGGHYSRPYGQTRARLQFIREEIEFDELDLDFDSAPDGDLFDAERDRFGFRAEFGSREVGGFFQIFGEEFRAPSLLVEEFDLFGFGGGVAGMPVVGRASRLEFLVPFRFGVNVAGGSESVGGFDSDLVYGETEIECGFGVRAFGAQASTGILANSFGGLYESDDPTSASSGDATVLSGTNVGAYVEILYKHDRVPLMARARGIIGDVSGVQLSFGFAF